MSFVCFEASSFRTFFCFDANNNSFLAHQNNIVSVISIIFADHTWHSFNFVHIWMKKHTTICFFSFSIYSENWHDTADWTLFLFSVFPSVVKTGLILENSIPSTWLLKNRALEYHLVLRLRWESFVGCVTAVYIFFLYICTMKTKNSNLFFSLTDRRFLFYFIFLTCFLFFSIRLIIDLKIQHWCCFVVNDIWTTVCQHLYTILCLSCWKVWENCFFGLNLSLDVHSLKTACKACRIMCCLHSLSVSPLYKHKHNKISSLSWRLSSIHVFCFALKAVHFDCESVCATEILWTKYLKWCVPMLLNYYTFIGMHFRQKSNLTSKFKPIYFWPWYKWWMIC